MKTCSKCKSEKPETDFYLRSVVTGKRRADCKACCAAWYEIYNKENREGLAAQQKVYRAVNREEIAAKKKVYDVENREKIAARRGQKGSNRFYKYGVTPDVFQAMTANQGGACAICEKEIKLCIDHDHETGKVRGLLCSACNRGIGFLRDSSDIACRAANYLKQHGN